MTYRQFDTGTWQDPWFEDLGHKAKLAFIYLWTNEVCNQAGIYEISNKRIKFELGYSIDTVYSELDTRILWDNTRHTVWVKNFFRRQCQNCNFAKAALSSIKNDTFKLSLFIPYNQVLIESFKKVDGSPRVDLSRYPIDTVSIPLSTEQSRTEQNRTEQNRTEQNRTEQNRKKAAEAEPTPEPEKTSLHIGSFPGSSPGPFIPKANGYQKATGEYFQSIKDKCLKIETFPINGLDELNPHQFVQQQIKVKVHPGAIDLALGRLIEKWDTVKTTRFGYLKHIVSVESQNFNEQEAIAIHDELKKAPPGQLAELTKGLFKKL